MSEGYSTVDKVGSENLLRVDHSPYPGNERFFAPLKSSQFYDLKLSFPAISAHGFIMPPHCSPASSRGCLLAIKVSYRVNYYMKYIKYRNIPGWRFAVKQMLRRLEL